MKLFNNSDCFRKGVLFIFYALIIHLPGYSQLIEYHPSFALSSGLGFSNDMASETSFLLRNEFTIKDDNIGNFCPIIGIGYTNRTYNLQYQTPEIDYFSGPVYMRSAVLEISVLIRLTSWRKLRKTMIPFLGLNSFRFLSKDMSKEENDFCDRVDPSLGEAIKNYRIHHMFFSLETGMEFVKDRWPRLCLSVLWEFPDSNDCKIESPNSEFYFRSSSMWCPRLVIGLRL